MPTRYNTNAKRKFGQAPLPSGYDAKDVPQDFTIPSVGIKDVDTALFYLFDQEIPIQVIAPDKKTGAAVMKDVPVIFAGGEKWAMIKKGRAVRDMKGSLVLPLITIGRKNIRQTPNEDISGRGINQQAGELVIRRRLDRTDRSYQNLINRLLLKNQENVGVNPTSAPVSGQLETTREIGDRSVESVILDGGLLDANRRKNIWETIVIPAPQFFTVQYDIIIWAQYDIQMNQILEQLMSSFLPQGNAWRLDARDDEKVQKGYWFVATVDGNLYTAQNNFDDMSMTERHIKYQFTVNVPAYVLASTTPGAPVPIRRYVSVPSIDFSVSTDIGLAELAETSSIDDPFLGSDDPTLPLNNSPTSRADQRRDGTLQLTPNRISEHDPALENLPRGMNPSKYRKIMGINHKGEEVCKYVKIKTVNIHSGETVYAADTDLGGLNIVLIDD